MFSVGVLSLYANITLVRRQTAETCTPKTALWGPRAEVCLPCAPVSGCDWRRFAPL